MAKIHSMMDIGKRSMMNSQTALQTVAHNIANKTTEGYSRQRVEQVTAPSITEGHLQLGQGARAATITRTNNPYLDKQLQKETGVKGFLDGESNALTEVEQIFNEQQNKGLNSYVSDFFNSWRELSNNPESVTTRSLVKESAEAMTTDFHRVRNSLRKVQEGVDTQLKANVEDINKTTQEIASLNEKISMIEMQGNVANDERDRRDLLVKKLTEKIDIKVAEGDGGMISVSTAGNAILVSGEESRTLETFRNPMTDKLEVAYNDRHTSTPPFVITSRIRGGVMGGALHIRDGIVEDLMDKMDTLAFTVADQVNSAHVNGYDRKGQPGGLFFENLGDTKEAALNLKLDSAIFNDVTKIAAAGRAGAPGDNTVANVVSQIQYHELMEDGTSTLDDFYNAQVGRIGVITNKSVKASEAQVNILNQVEKMRESVSGVSLDEEAVNMIEHQKAFEASARLIKTADEMFDTVLALKR